MVGVNLVFTQCLPNTSVSSSSRKPTVSGVADSPAGAVGATRGPAFAGQAGWYRGSSNRGSRPYVGGEGFSVVGQFGKLPPSQESKQYAILKGARGASSDYIAFLDLSCPTAKTSVSWKHLSERRQCRTGCQRHSEPRILVDDSRKLWGSHKSFCQAVCGPGFIPGYHHH